MRADRVSLLQASKEFGIDPRTVTRWGKQALRKQPNGRYAAKPRDQLLRILKLPTNDGLIEVPVRDSREASRIAKYSNAVQKYLRTGDSSDLREFVNVHITDADGIQIPLLTNAQELDRLGASGLFSFESLYARTA